MIRPMAKIWTFLIRGEPQVTITAPHQPAMHHPGLGFTVWKMVGDEEEAGRLQKLLEEEGLTVERYTESQSKEQEQERLRRVGRIEKPTEE